MFELCADVVECVVLNACYSQVQARAIAKDISYVVGMKKAIGDKAAIEFSVGFYDALGVGRDYEFAYKWGCSAVRMAGIKENLTPVLIQLKSVPIQKIGKSPPELGDLGGLDVTNETSQTTSEKGESQDFYINCPPVEETCFSEIEQQGALLRIKASQKMGKTFLLILKR